MRIENIKPDDLEIKGVYTPAKKVDCGDYSMIYVSGIQAPMGDDRKVITDDIGEQTRLVFEDINNILKIAGASLDNVIKAVIYLTDMNDFEIVSPIRAEYFKNSMPVSTMVEVNRLTRDGAKIEIEVTALLEK
ncbi:MAG: RidA family protein [Bacilli bacterium]|nr:RidA family protein [Bacilli bacterium]MDE6141595.1 RidA family protein [Bacilli bacterium]